jgi:5-methylcytosine-specific restriction endonuclease McrA
MSTEEQKKYNREKQARWRAANPEKVRAKDAKYRNKNRKKISESNRKWNAAHPTKLKEAHIKWETNHPEDAKESRRKWRYANPDKVAGYVWKWQLKNPTNNRERAQKRYALLQGATIGEVDFDFIWNRDGGICYLCNLPINPTNVHFDHVIPLSRNGSHSSDNLRPTHPRCNLIKHDKLVEELGITVRPLPHRPDGNNV